MIQLAANRWEAEGARCQRRAFFELRTVGVAKKTK
jgi:hypothetical protein